MGQVSSRYSWGDDSAVKTVDFVVSADGKSHSAMIYAGDNVERGGLAKIPSALTRYGFSNIFADATDGKNVLVIDGIKDVEKVISALSNLGVTKGEPQKETFKVQLEKGSKSAWLKRNALNINGVFGVTGHAAMAGTGVLQNDKDRMWNGVLGAMVPLLLGVCGNGKDGLEFDPMFEGMRKYFAAEGLQLPVFTEKHKTGLVDTIKHFVASHPVPIAYSIGMLAGYKGLKSAYTQVSKGQGGVSRLAAVGTSQVGNLVVLGIPEKEKNMLEHDENKDTSLGKEIVGHFKAFAQDPVAAVQAAPMFWDGALKFFDNILYGMATLDDINKINNVWAKNRNSKDYVDLASSLIDRLNKLGVNIEDADQLASLVVPAGRTSGKFGELIAGMEKEEDILKSLRNGHGFNPNGVVKALEATGKAAEEDRALFGEMEKFARMEEEYRIATSPLGKRSPWLAGITAATFTIATAAEAMASKNRDASYMKSDAYQKLFAMASRMVNDVPEEERAFVTHKMAIYLAGQPDVHNAGITSERIEKEINQRIDAMNNSPWMPHSSAHIKQALRVTDSVQAAAQGQGASV